MRVDIGDTRPASGGVHREAASPRGTVAMSGGTEADLRSRLSERSAGARGLRPTVAFAPSSRSARSR